MENIIVSYQECVSTLEQAGLFVRRVSAADAYPIEYGISREIPLNTFRDSEGRGDYQAYMAAFKAAPTVIIGRLFGNNIELYRGKTLGQIIEENASLDWHPALSSEGKEEAK